MTIFDGDRDKLLQYIRLIADLCGLKDWEYELDEEPPESESADAAIHNWYGQRHAQIRLHPKWPDWTPERLRSRIVHELVHSHLHCLEEIVSNLKSTLGEPAYNVASNFFGDLLETATDDIAVAWARTLPLPSADAEHVEVGGEIEEAA